MAHNPTAGAGPLLQVSSKKAEYNAKEQVAESHAANSQVTRFEYDEFGRPTATLGGPHQAPNRNL